MVPRILNYVIALYLILVGVMGCGRNWRRTIFCSTCRADLGRGRRRSEI
jgi:hypothetical protein